MRSKEIGSYADSGSEGAREMNAGLHNMLEGIHEVAIASSVVNWSGPLDKSSVRREDLPEGSINTKELIKRLHIGNLGFQRFGIVDGLTPVLVEKQFYWSPEQQELAEKKLERIRVDRKESRSRGEKLPVRIKPKPKISDDAVLKHTILSKIDISQPHFSRLGLDEGLKPIFTNGTKFYTVGEERIIKGRYNKYLIYKKLKKEDRERERKFKKFSPSSEDHVSREGAAMTLGCGRETLARIRRNGQGLTALEVDRNYRSIEMAVGVRTEIAREKVVGYNRKQFVRALRRAWKPERKKMPKPEVPEGYIDTTAALEILDRSRVWLLNYRIENNLTVLKIGITNYFLKTEVEALLEGRGVVRKKRGGKIYGGNEELSNSFIMHLKEIAKYPLLDRESEKQIGARIFAGQLGMRALSVMLEGELLESQLEKKVREFLGTGKIKNILQLLNSRPSTKTLEVKEELIEEEAYDEEDSDANEIESVDTSRAGTIHRFGESLAENLNRINKLSPYDRRAEIEALTERYIFLAEQGIKSYDLLINSNLRLVVSIAKNYLGRMDLEDLNSYGHPGLMKAAGRFNFRKGFKFSTYATWWIRQSITRAIADYSRTIRIPVHAYAELNMYRALNRELVQELGREPTSEEVFQKMGKVSDTLRQAILVEKTVSLNQTIGDSPGYDASELGDFIEDPEADVQERASNLSMRGALRDALKTLNDPRAERILMLRFGLEDGISRTLEEVGREFDVTRERIRQIEARALGRLRHPSRSRKLRGFIDD